MFLLFSFPFSCPKRLFVPYFNRYHYHVITFLYFSGNLTRRFEIRQLTQPIAQRAGKRQHSEVKVFLCSDQSSYCRRLAGEGPPVQAGASREGPARPGVGLLSGLITCYIGIEMKGWLRTTTLSVLAIALLSRGGLVTQLCEDSIGSTTHSSCFGSHLFITILLFENPVEAHMSCDCCSESAVQKSPFGTRNCEVCVYPFWRLMKGICDLSLRGRLLAIHGRRVRCALSLEGCCNFRDLPCEIAWRASCRSL